VLWDLTEVKRRRKELGLSVEAIVEAIAESKVATLAKAAIRAVVGVPSHRLKAF